MNELKKDTSLISGRGEDDVQWITVNGAHVPLKDGESPKEAIANRFDNSNDTKNDDKDRDVNSSKNSKEYNDLGLKKLAPGKQLVTKEWLCNKTGIYGVIGILAETEKAYRVVALPHGIKGMLDIQWVPKSGCELITPENKQNETVYCTFDDAREMQRQAISDYS